MALGRFQTGTGAGASAAFIASNCSSVIRAAGFRVLVTRMLARRVAVAPSGVPMISQKALAVCGRSAGTLASAAMTASSTSSGTEARTSWSPGTGVMAWRAMMARALGPVKGGVPASIS